jgi:hypothetical protein
MHSIRRGCDLSYVDNSESFHKFVNTLLSVENELSSFDLG